MPRLSTRPLLLAAFVAVLLTSACGKKRSSASTPRRTPSRAGTVATTGKAKAAPAAPAVAKPGTTEVGLASWYGEPYHGRRAANGEIYDMNRLTAAHRTLPFDTLVDVLNLDNRQEVKVRITDRGPFVDGRIIDLSRAAAQQISLLGPGTAKVRIQVLGVQHITEAPPQSAPLTPATAPALPAPAPAAAPASVLPAEEEPCPEPPATDVQVSGGSYAIQIGAFSEVKAAEKLQKRMASRYGNAYIENVRSDKGMLYRVRVGPKQTMAEAAQVAASLEKENVPSMVVRVSVPVKN